MLEMDDLITREAEMEDFSIEIIDILTDLKRLNVKANEVLMQSNKTYKEKYHELWKHKCWKEGRALLNRYFTLKGNGVLRCPVCKSKINSKYVLHHKKDFYNLLTDCFNPLYVELLCSKKCHSKVHKK